MSTTNDITGDSIQSKANGSAYRNGYDAIWGKKELTVKVDADGLVRFKCELSDADIIASHASCGGEG